MSEQQKQEQVKLKEHKVLSETEKLRLSNLNLQLDLLDEKKSKLELEYQVANAMIKSIMSNLVAAHYPNAKADEVILDAAQGIIGLIDKGPEAPKATEPAADEPKADEPAKAAASA